MLALADDLQTRKKNLDEFYFLARRVLNYLPNVVSNYNDKGDYRLYNSEIAGTLKYLRPINMRLFLSEIETFEKGYSVFSKTIEELKSGKREFLPIEELNIDQVLYTIQQSIGAGLDLLVNQNSARKHVGNRFEELMKALFTEVGISNKRVVLSIPYDTEEGDKIYKCENDLIISPFTAVKSTAQHLDEREIVVGVKTTSKDRMGKMFIDKMLLERFVKHKQRVIGIFLNDVQRKEANNVSYTLVSGLFMVYTKFLTELEGIYYLDPPPNVGKQPYRNHMKPFSKLLVEDVWKFLSS